jgi:outer membrane receptor protein involved in Fe transport
MSLTSRQSHRHFAKAPCAQAVSFALSTAGCLMTSAALAQAPAPAQTVEKIEITGSSIKRIEGEGALPIQVITREDIEKGGSTTAAELLTKISANSAALTDGFSFSDIAGQRGFSGANLRGIGVSSTLILLNGRRIANFASPGSASGVDLNSIPSAAIERVEVLKDGASAIYGTDAISGVINFITRREYTGVDLHAYVSDTQHGGAGKSIYTLSGGMGNLDRDRFNVFGVLDYQDNKTLRSTQRSWIKGAFQPDINLDVASSNTYPANYRRIRASGSAVAWIRSNGFQAKNISFENTFNRAHGDDVTDKGTPAIHSQAVAMLVDDADKVQFENVRFSSYQDTLYLKSSAPTLPARSFFNKVYIEGDMDFIFGEGVAYFYQSEIRSLGDRRISYVTAPSTHVSSKYGFVFDTSRFTHDGTANSLAGKFRLTRQWFRGQRCTPFGAMARTPGYRCRLGIRDSYEALHGTITREVLETVGKVVIVNSTIGPHIDKARPWADWNADGTIKHRPVQTSSDDFWDHLLQVGIDPIRDLGYAGRTVPAEPFLAEYNNRDE